MAKRTKTASKNPTIKDASSTVDSNLYVGPTRKHNKVATKMVNHIATTQRAQMSKIAACYPASGGLGSGSGMFNTETSFASFYDPYFEPSTLVLPRNLLEINAWCRYFYKYDPYVSTAIDMHAELPLSKMRLQPPKSADKRRSQMILEHFVKMVSNDGIDLYNKLLQIGVEYYKLGNVFPYLQLNENKTAWEKLTLLDPDYINIEKLQFTNAMKIELIPNDRLREIINRGDFDQHTGVLSQTIDPVIKTKVQSAENIPLGTNTLSSHVSHIARKMGDYEVLGTSLIERNFKALVYKDRLRRSQDAIAVRHLTPKHLVWTDSNANDVDIEALREQVENALVDPDYAIITNFEIHWDLVGTNSALMQLSGEWEWINDELMVGLMMNKSFILGEGAFANGQTVLEILEQRYGIYRSTLEDWIESHVFKPIALLNNFSEKRTGFVRNSKGDVVEQEIEVLLYPSIKWNRLNLTDDNQHKQMLSQMVDRGFLDVETWLEYFGLDADIILDKINRFKDSPLDPNYQDLQRSIQTEVGRIIGPAIAKKRAEEMGLDLPDDQNQYANDESVNFVKLAGNDVEDMPVTTKNLYATLVSEVTEYAMQKLAEKDGLKTAESREERKRQRHIQKLKRVQQDRVKSNEIDTEKKTFPGRSDVTKYQKNVKLFGSEESEIEKNAIDIDDIVIKKNEVMNPDMETESTYSPREKLL